MGVEEELLLMSADGRPLPISKAVAAGAGDIDVELELTRAQVEINTPVCTTAEELNGQLRKMRSVLAVAAAEKGARLCAVAAPPAGEAEQAVTKKPRYQEMEKRYGLLAREQGVCGCHVHIDVPDPEAAVRVSNHLRPWMPTLLALTANSAIYLGADTGFASWRSIMWSRWPCSGPPPYFESAEHYEALVAMQLASGSIMDERMVYWDIRPSSHLSTVEVRISDVPLTIDETVLLATLIRALVMTALDDGGLGPKLEPEVLRAAYWLAARDGIEGNGLDVLRARPLPMSGLLGFLQRHVAPALEELGEADAVAEAVQRQLRDGNGAMKQRKVFREGDDIITLTEIKP
ncbi:YbdK family carboxylate-amine ligase [Kribbella qitaiheensis]|uniref:Putative glutamate--cysteine ligase 2 n=1 Tax=Kribbella qitaiheensis TaxID=1544730 RepID=A0A7G6X8R0_9ACTN|nr:glutamate--cysteine ligase [Kribbella qitaiheensis]QNE22625.1 YbdK family carboxylate-amine ligase [Kribbella qitaiheensis]